MAFAYASDGETTQTSIPVRWGNTGGCYYSYRVEFLTKDTTSGETKYTRNVLSDVQSSSSSAVSYFSDLDGLAAGHIYDLKCQVYFRDYPNGTITFDDDPDHKYYASTSSSYTGTLSGYPTVPKTPYGFSVSSITDSQAKVSWTAITCSGYERYYGTDSWPWTNHDDDAARGETITGLDSETTYHYRARAYVSGGSATGQTQYSGWGQTSFTTAEPAGAQVYIYTGSKWVKATPYVYSGSGWGKAAAFVYKSGWKT